VGVHSAEQSAEIDAPPAACFDAITDYETFPEWQRAVRAVEVRDRDAEGRGEIVRFDIDAKVRRLSYTLHYRYDAPARIWWEFLEGDGVDHVEGEFLFEALDGGARTLAVYRLGIDAGVPIPGLLARRLTEGVMGRAVRDLRGEVERRLAT
jgi:hypothetical protein